MRSWIKSLNAKQQAVLALIIANIIWGAASPIFKWSLTNIPLFSLAYFRFFIPSILVLPLVRKQNLGVSRSLWPPLIALSLLGITANITFFFVGLKFAPSINAPIIASSGPIFLILGSVLFLHERPKSKTILGTLISLVGVLIIVGRPLLEKGFDLNAFWGNISFIFATFGAVGATLIIKRTVTYLNPLVLTFWSFLIGAMSFFPFFAWETLKHSWYLQLDIRGMGGLFFGIIFSTTLAYALDGWALSQIEASEAGLFTYIDPVIAALIAIPLLGEVITPLFILGSFFVFAGIFVAENRLHYHPFHKLRAQITPATSIDK